MITYGLCQHHVETARNNFKWKQFTHDSLMRHLKAVYECRKRMHTAYTLRTSEHVPDNL